MTLLSLLYILIDNTEIAAMMVLPALIPDPRQKTDTRKVIYVLEVSTILVCLCY